MVSIRSALPRSESLQDSLEQRKSTIIQNFANKFAGFGRGDVNNDDVINLLDLVRLANWIADASGC